jgi:hypothetical protein
LSPTGKPIFLMFTKKDIVDARVNKDETAGAVQTSHNALRRERLLSELQLHAAQVQTLDQFQPVTITPLPPCSAKTGEQVKGNFQSITRSLLKLEQKEVKQDNPSQLDASSSAQKRFDNSEARFSARVTLFGVSALCALIPWGVLLYTGTSLFGLGPLTPLLGLAVGLVVLGIGKLLINHYSAQPSSILYDESKKLKTSGKIVDSLGGPKPQQPLQPVGPGSGKSPVGLESARTEATTPSKTEEQTPKTDSTQAPTKGNG